MKHEVNKVTNMLVLEKKKKMSNASANIIELKFFFPRQHKFKKLLYFKKSNSGRSKNGSIVVYSKKKRSKKLLPLINYNFRSNCLFLLSGVNYTNYNKNIFSTMINSLGEISYLTLKNNNFLFLFSKIKPLLSSSLHLIKNLIFNFHYHEIKIIKYLTIQQSKNSILNLIEVKPLTGVKYTRSWGSKSSLLKLDYKTGLCLIRLSSGIKKLISIFSLSSSTNKLNVFKSRITSSKSGDSRKLGLKSIVRGNAKNPVDHPHGGRTKSIKYPKTPWGKTTKYK